ncbi:OmpA family protein [Actinomycetospora termitidis]|uniref:OmpA family protein n=1 Tax=Actinomycetospora termitidis TaxID=3053470 RepID=A0ABT7M8C4_9PSEU|nr:OmpA family protein [Actinomycetospora sp. Odt1-22]MDL5155683.1 OmpA family protein [Actinomycetospora sp. Odt1-22]
MSRRLALALATAAVLVLGACSSGDDSSGGFASGGGGGAPLSCPVPVGPMAIAVGGRANEPEPGLPGAVQQAAITVVSGAADQKVQPKFTVVSVDGRPTVAGSDTYRTDAGNAIAAQDDQNAFLSGLGDAISQLRAQTPEADTLGALTLAGRSVQGSRPGTVVLVDSGLSTVAPLDFRTEGLLAAPVQDVVSSLRDANALPSLNGATVVLAGIGDVAEPQGPLDTSQRASLVALWRGIAEAGGASCVAVVDEPRSGDAPSDVPPVSTVALPPPPTITPGRSTALPDDGSVGFRPDTAEFRDENAARGVLGPFADFVKQGPTHRLALTGTTARAGSPASQVDLSTRRAEAVKGLLVSLGAAADRITTKGVGSQFPGYVNDVGPGGRQLPGPAATNRKVIVDPTA